MKDIIAEINDNPLDEDLFFDLVKIADQAVSGKLRVIPPDAERCLEGNGFYLTDIPENQMGMAVTRECLNRFGKDKGSQIAVRYTYRWFALCEARHSGLLDEFSEAPEGGRIETDIAVFQAAARAPIGSDLQFVREEYLRLINQIISGRNPSWNSSGSLGCG